MSLVVETRLVHRENFFVLLLAQGCLRSEWMFSEFDLLQKVLLFPSAIGNTKCPPFWRVDKTIPLH